MDLYFMNSMLSTVGRVRIDKVQPTWCQNSFCTLYMLLCISFYLPNNMIAHYMHLSAFQSWKEEYINRHYYMKGHYINRHHYMNVRTTTLLHYHSSTAHHYSI